MINRLAALSLLATLLGCDANPAPPADENVAEDIAADSIDPVEEMTNQTFDDMVC